MEARALLMENTARAITLALPVHRSALQGAIKSGHAFILCSVWILDWSASPTRVVAASSSYSSVVVKAALLGVTARLRLVPVPAWFADGARTCCGVFVDHFRKDADFPSISSDLLFKRFTPLV